MKLEIPDAFTPKSAKEYAREIEAHRTQVRKGVCQKVRDELISQFPAVASLENSLQIFNNSGYGSVFKEEVSWWIEEKLYYLYDNISNLSDKEIKSFTVNFEWYNAVLLLLHRTHYIFQEQFFDLKHPDNQDSPMALTTDNISLVTGMLDASASVLGMAELEKIVHKEQVKRFNKLKHCYEKFVEDVKKHVDGIFYDNDKYYYLLGAEREEIFTRNPISLFIKDIGKNVAARKPKKRRYHSQKISNTSVAKSICIIKMVYDYLDRHFRVDGRIAVHNHYCLLEEIGNELYMELEDSDRTYFDRETVKGILKKGQL